MNNPLGADQGSPELAEEVQQRLRDELAALRIQRDQLRGDNAEDHRAADTGDRAEALRSADDVFRIEDRISQINQLVTVGTTVRAVGSKPNALAEGSTVTLRFADGDEETFYASSILDTAPGGSQVELLGLNSPLAKAIAGHTIGDTISWVTPTGSHHADVVTIQSSTSLRH
jgi:transcription elongation GreA/GreB family factor